MYWCATHWTELPESTICGQLWGTEMEFTRLVFWNLNGETFRARAESVLARLRWDRVENMSGEMKLTPTFSFLSPAPRSPLRAQPSSHFLGKEEENIPLTMGIESLQLLSLFIFTHLSSLWFIVPLHSLSGVHCPHTHTHIHMHSQTFFTFMYLVSSPTFPLAPSSSLQQWLKSWMYWHVSFHHPTICEEDRGECTDLGECVLRRKGPSQP